MITKIKYIDSKEIDYNKGDIIYLLEGSRYGQDFEILRDLTDGWFLLFNPSSHRGIKTNSMRFLPSKQWDLREFMRRHKLSEIGYEKLYNNFKNEKSIYKRILNYIFENIMSKKFINENLKLCDCF